MRIARSGLCLGICALAAIVMAGMPAQAQQPLKIGLILPYTGQFTDASGQIDDAIKLYIKDRKSVV